MIDARAIPAARACAALCLLVGCGDYVEYDPALPREAGAEVDGGLLLRDAAAAFTHVCRDAVAPAVDAAGYDGLLARHVARDAAGFALVDYTGWAASAQDRQALDAFVDAVGDARPSGCDLAFWIDAYNANVLRSVLEQFAVDSGYSVSRDDFAFFVERSHRVAGVTLSLDELEHGVVRGDFAHRNVVDSLVLTELRALHAELWQGARVDARIHMALNCAARGCPNLRDGAYAGSDLDAKLEDATRAFLDNAVKGAGPQGISRLFSWFAVDFAREAGTVDAFIEAHRSAGTAGVELVTFIEYDWSLNGE